MAENFCLAKALGSFLPTISNADTYNGGIWCFLYFFFSLDEWSRGVTWDGGLGGKIESALGGCAGGCESGGR
jgi:hypothetical protein